MSKASKQQPKLRRVKMWGVFEFDEGKYAIIRAFPSKEGAEVAARDWYWMVLSVRPVICEYEERKK